MPPTYPSNPERWRQLLSACRVARGLPAVAGAREAARLFAFELSAADCETRLRALALLAAMAAKNDCLELPRVGDVEAIWAELERLPADLRREWLDTAARRRRARCRHAAEPSREPLPVEAARAMPLDRVAERLGLRLTRRGHMLAASCPFHDDRHPSLFIDVRKGLWHCFPCGIGGDGIALVMRLRGVGFSEAVQAIAS